MIIDSSSIQMFSQRTAVQTEVSRQSLKVWIGSERPKFKGEEGQGPAVAPADTVSISDAARNRLAAEARHQTAKIAAEAKEAERIGDEEYDLEDDPKYRLVKLIVEYLTGEEIDVMSPEELRKAVQPKNLPDAHHAKAEQSEAPQKAGFGVEYDAYHAVHEAETTSFSAEGIIKTADGKEISFKAELLMSRTYDMEESVSIRAGDAVPKVKDPLVINFNGNAAQVTDTKFAFDLDTDGKVDQISFVNANSGFLALDANGDGKVNDGSELFGPRTGDGFAELAQYDQDSNGWIDEKDAVFNQLLVWSKDAQGQDSLVGLKQRGVGAIYLGQVSTQFDVKNAQNALQGQVKATGLYANEDGTVGTVQQVDLAL